jgi:hypothetical protein
MSDIHQTNITNLKESPDSGGTIRRSLAETGELETKQSGMGMAWFAMEMNAGLMNQH